MTYINYSIILVRNVNTIKYKFKNKNQSVCQILNLPSSQSVVSQLGFITEKSVNEYIQTYSNINYLKNSYLNILNHQIDILFEYNNIVYYFECKNNIELDTEKSIKCKQKLQTIYNFLKKEFKNKEICCKILCMWTNTSLNNNSYIKNPLNINDIYGYNDFFNIFNISANNNQFRFLNTKLRIKLLKNIKTNEIPTSPKKNISNYKFISLQRKHQLLKRKYNEI